MPKENTLDEIKNICSENNYKLIKVYLDKNRFKKLIISDFDGYKYDTVLNRIRQKRNINIVNKGNPYSLENISTWTKLNRSEYVFSKNNKIYLDSKQKLEFYHTKCKDYFYISWDNFHRGKKCSICYGNQAGKYHNVKYLRPDLLEEWDKSNDILPEFVSLGSHKNILWKCKNCGYEYFAKVYDKVDGIICSVCTGRIVSDKNRLSILYPEISKQWHPTKNGSLKPKDFSYGSNSYVWWKCNVCCHEWEAKISSRTFNKRGCPKCNESHGEKEIGNILKKYKIKFETQKRYVDCRNVLPLPFDFYLPNLKILIEYHGGQHYEIPTGNWFNGKRGLETRKRMDKIKENYCKKNKIKLIIIPYWEFDNIEKILTKKLKIL